MLAETGSAVKRTAQWFGQERTQLGGKGSGERWTDLRVESSELADVMDWMWWGKRAGRMTGFWLQQFIEVEQTEARTLWTVNLSLVSHD